MNRHSITWAQPSPFWSEMTTQLPRASAAEFTRPAILRFTTDAFMDELLDILATDPRRLAEYRVRPETWRGFTPPPAAPRPKKAFALPLQRLGFAQRNLKERIASEPATRIAIPPPSIPTLKLYAPAAQRYYLAASCLVCQTPGLPDRRVEPARAERVSLLMRRLFPPGNDASRPIDEWEEHAWVEGASGNSWRKLARENVTAPAQTEERLPMFPLNFKEDDGHGRRLLAALIPVGKREAYLGGAISSSSAAPPGVTTKTARKILFRKEIAEPWKALIAQAALAANQLAQLSPPSPADRAAKIAIEREGIQGASWLVLVDFDRFLHEYLPAVHASVHGQTPADPLTPEQAVLLTALGNTKVGNSLAAKLSLGTNIPRVASSLRDALRGIDTFAPALEATVTAYVRTDPATAWPNFLFPLADPELPAQAPLPPAIPLSAVADEEKADLTEPLHAVDTLTLLVVRALPAATPASEPAIPPSAVAPGNALDGWFVLRCAYERPACGPLHDDVVSPPSEPFQLAGFFDPDAPARPIRIGLPMDVSPAGLRKFDKNTAFVMSDMLCGQIKRFQGLTLGDLVRSVLPFPLHKDLSAAGGGPCTSGGINIGTICSLSIPIITICALILLIIIVSLLNMIFRWLPFFMICFPVPGLKGKK
jgi:hypothetical protein